MSKKVSIILPVYNGAKCVANSIDSVLSQTYENFELVVVNDCSTDNTLDILNEYAKKDSRVKVFTNEVNKKLPRTLNAGFEKATGEYLTWTSDDNMYRPEAIAQMVQFLDENPEVGLVYCDMTVRNELGDEIKEEERVAAPVKDLRLRSICGACFMYRSEVAVKAGDYDPDLFLAEDYEYWIRISKNAKIAPLHKNLYIYRLQGQSLTGSLKWERIKAQKLKVINLHFDYLYSLCENEEDKISFFNNYIKCCSKDNRKAGLAKVCALMPAYKKIARTNSINDMKYRIKVFLHIEK